jgi:hypothetical protein
LKPLIVKIRKMANQTKQKAKREREGGRERVEERGWKREGGRERAEEKGWKREAGNPVNVMALFGFDP